MRLNFVVSREEEGGLEFVIVSWGFANTELPSVRAGSGCVVGCIGEWWEGRKGERSVEEYVSVWVT